MDDLYNLGRSEHDTPSPAPGSHTFWERLLATTPLPKLGEVWLRMKRLFMHGVDLVKPDLTVQQGLQCIFHSFDVFL